jgi:hypothetical protein
MGTNPQDNGKMEVVFDFKKQVLKEFTITTIDGT